MHKEKTLFHRKERRARGGFLYILISAILAISAVQSFGFLRADLNRDGFVDFNDFAMFAREWQMEDLSMANKVLRFDGISTQYVTVPNNAALNVGTGSFSLVLWWKPMELAGMDFLFDKESGADAGYSLKVHPDKYIWFVIDDGSNYAELELQDVLNIGSWHNLVFVCDRLANTLTAYVNGVASTPVDISAVTGSLDNTNNVFWAGGGSFKLKGDYDSVALYKKALSPAEAAAIHNNSIGTKLTGDEDGLSWGSNCDDGTGSTLTDITGTVNGTLTGNVADNMWADGGVPFSAQYVLKRDGVEIATVADGQTQIAIEQDYATLGDGTYEYTLTPVSEYGIEGAESEPLEIVIVDGGISQMPAADPTDLAVEPIAGGKFRLKWRYQYKSDEVMPTGFNVYYSLNEVDWTLDGQIAYRFQSVASAYNTQTAWDHDTEVFFKVIPVKNTTERANNNVVSAISDAEGPIVSTGTLAVTAVS